MNPGQTERQKSYKWCIIPMTTNASHTAPNKLFINVPKDRKTRKKWILTSQRNAGDILGMSIVYFCKDHFNLLIGYECGQIVLWDLKTRAAELRFQSSEALRSISWHHEGKQFMCSHADGSLSTWAVRQSPKPISVIQPHAKANKEGKLESCKPIQKVEWKTSRTGEAYVIFSGGLTYDKAGRTPSITVIHGKATTVLEMEHNVVDFITLCESPWVSDFQDPYAIVVLLHNDLVVIDLLSPGYPCFENPYPMDLHESPVTCCSYLADCPSDLIPAFYSVGSRSQKRTGFSEREWPLSGGEWSPTSCSYNEIILTGHADGSIKFWDASAGTLQVLYKLKTAKVFEKPRARSVDGVDEDPFAIQLISLCPESRKLCVAGASSQVILFKFRKLESVSEIYMLEIPINYEANEEEGDCSPEYEYPPRPSLASKNESMEGESKKSSLEYTCPLRVRSGQQKKPPGFQAHLVCLTPYVNGEQPSSITALSINSSYGLMAYGNECGIVIVDIIQKICLMNMGTPDLYGSADPYQRVPRSPKRNQGDNNSDERCRSPSTDQVAPTSKCLEPAIVPVDAAVSLTSPSPSPLFKMASNDSEDPDLESLTPGGGASGYCSDVSPAALTPDVDQAEEAFTSLPPDSPYPPCDMKQEASPNETAPPENKPHDHGRRRSSAWKGFSLKKQFSRVDQKLKNTFSVGAQMGTVAHSSSHVQQTREKRSSVFYTTSASADAILTPSILSPVEPRSPHQSVDEPDKEVGTPDSIEAEKILVTPLIQVEEGATELPVTPKEPTQIIIKSPESDSEMLNEIIENGHSCVRESKSIEQLEISDETEEGVPCGIPVVEEKVTRRLSRPVDLPLFDAEGKPVRPPRRENKKKSTVEKRDMRLLSVPNIKYSKQDHSLRDLRQKDDTGQNQPSFGNLIRRLNKLDSSFSRSRSSSMSSLENISSEAIQCLAFADSYTKKADPSTFPTLWIGTSLGSVLTIMLSVPPAGETRLTQPVVASPCGTIFRLKGCILTMSFLDCNGALIPYSYEAWRDENKEGKERIKTPTKGPSNNRMSPTLSGQTDQFGDRQFVVLTSEKQARVVALPSHNCVYRQQLADTDFVVKAEIISLKDSVCLVCYVSSGHVTAYSLPSLRPLIDIEFLPLADLRIARTFCFSNRGHGLYLCSPSEVQKFTVSSEFCLSLQEMVGELFLPHDMPEPPKESFFKGLFGGGSRSLDREELFGEASGRASRSVAKHIPGPSANMEALNQQTRTVTGEIARTHQLMVERGEKLSQLEERSARMMTEADTFSSTAHNLMLKYKDKKWYQL